MLFNKYAEIPHGDKATSIINDAREKFGWDPSKVRPGLNGVSFFETKYPFSDNEYCLTTAISKLSPEDRVLTTPTQEPFFRAGGISDVSVYDISIAQLEDSQNIGPKHWCDIFHPELLSNLLEEARPTVMHLSNIPEWAQSEDQLRVLANQLNLSHDLKTIMHARVFKTGDVFLNEQLVSMGWNLEVVSDPKKRFQDIFILSRPDVNDKEV